ncbi:MAG: aldolase/citrate lyase family protein [Deltaproteobacteria bacterium]|nr:aldolase/citrate lyase family protein [Deltaproteobacteria bacterium]
MYRKNLLKKKLLEGQPTLSFWSHLASPIAAEIMALVGYDGAVIDMEHGPVDYLGATTLMQAMSGTSTIPIIRVPSNDPVEIKRALDTGVGGIMVPEVNSVAEAEALVRACLYPPQGKRGAASVLNRASSYGLDNVKYLEENGKELLVIAQIENLEAVANLEQIAAVDGIDVLFIGPNDLSGDCGKVGDYSNPIFIEALAKAEDLIKKSNKFLGGLPRACDSAGAMLERGYDFVISASDVLMLRDAALLDLKTNRELST